MAEEVASGDAAPGRPHALRGQWRGLTRAATAVAILTSPASFLWFHEVAHLSILVSIVLAVSLIVLFRGLVERVVRSTIPWPSLFDADADLRAADIVERRRAWTWRRFYFRWTILIVVVGGGGWLAYASIPSAYRVLAAVYVVQAILLLPLNFLILFGPFALMSVSQIRSYEPGDADWGVRLEDVRGQAEAKEEVRRIVTLWQSGEAFESRGGKRERGLLMLGAPGTGKTMLSKAIATGFNCPFVSIPGSGFAGMFIGMDAITVRLLARRAKKLAAKWGGQCIVFIDEIDAVGQRRSSLGVGGTMVPAPAVDIHDLCFFGGNGSLTPTGDLVLETRRWRERLFAERSSPVDRDPFPLRIGRRVDQAVPGGLFGGGQLALNQLLVVMDGIGGPPWARKTLVKLVNTLLDAVFLVPQRAGRLRLRLPKPRPSNQQIYFIGACNAPIESLDPALTRPGRMGRHVWFRTPTKDDRKDIFELYLSKVAHELDLDTPARRDELARITNGYSPAMIEQVCSMALTQAHFDGRPEFGWADIVEAMTTIESGTAVNVEYVPEETRAVAIHEAGHAAASHVYMKGTESTRISIRKRGGSLGHHQAFEKEERFSSWRHEETGRLVWTLGAMAAERVFYNENSTGVGGDVMSATTRAAWMVGSCAMGPDPIDLSQVTANDQERTEIEQRLMDRYERIGSQIMRRAGGGSMLQADPVAGVLGDRDKRRMAAQLLGQAYVKAHLLIDHNRAAVEHIADVLAERRELHGDEVVALLDGAALTIPQVDLTDEAAWPEV